MTFRVLHVCTGNICRSPMGELLMREGLRQRLGEGADAFVIESAGTWGQTGAPMEEFALSTLHGLGVDGTCFQARELVAEHVAAADLVLGATREHRAAAVVLQPRVARRAFTLREFDRLLSGIDPASLPTGDRVERAHAVVQAAAGQRGLIRADRPEDDDVTDPYKGPEAGFLVCGELVRATLQRPLDLLAG
jgi:protein-tyrosine phosphatase